MDVFGRMGITPGEWNRRSSTPLPKARVANAGGVSLVVTGLEEVDAKLAALEPKLQKKFVRQALRKSAKLVLEKFKEIVRAEAYDTGALAASATVRALKRSRQRIGFQILPDRDTLFAERMKRTKSTGLTKRKDIIAVHSNEWKDSDYYPAYIEFGYTRRDGTEQPAIRPQRRALYDNEETIRANFVKDVQELIAEAASK